MSPQEEEIKLSALSIQEGEWYNVFCPFCRASHEDKLSILKDGTTIVYRCLRASCGASGKIGSGGVSSVPKKKPDFIPKHYTKALTSIPDHVIEEVHEKYGLTYDDMVAQGFKWAVEDAALYMPVYNAAGIHVADCVKKLKLSYPKERKVITLYHKKDMNLHFPVGSSRDSTCVLVEGVLDAVKVNKLLSSVALLGTHLNNEQAVALRKKYSKLIFALDPDAQDKAVKLAKQWRCLFTTSVVMLRDDPKDLPLEELKEAFL